MTADGPNHQQHRTNKRKAKSDVSLVLIKRVNLALGLMGGQPTLPTGAALGLGAESDSAGPWAGRVGGQRAAPSPSLLLLTPRSPTSPPALTVPGGRPAPPLPGHSRVGGGHGEVSPTPPTSPAGGSHCTVERNWPGLDPGAHARAHTHTQAHACSSTRTPSPLVAQRGAHLGRAEAPTLLSHVPTPGPRAPGPPADIGRACLRGGQGGREGGLDGDTGPCGARQGHRDTGPRGARQVCSQGVVWSGHDGPQGSRITGRPQARGQRLYSADQPLPS